MQNSSPESRNPSEWLEQRQAIAWEPELIISGIVLFGLLQIPPGLDNIQRYLNDWGSTIFFIGNVDELLVAFLKTSVYLLICGLIANLLLRSVWVVMIGLSQTLPGGIDTGKLRLQPYYADKLRRIPSYAEYVVRLDKLASTVYSATFLLFMCLIGFSFSFLVLSSIFLLLLNFEYMHRFLYAGSWFNRLFNLTFIVFGGIYLLDFLTLGWLKRFRLYTTFYRPLYALMSVLTLAPLYRGIYYGLISRFNRWKIFAGLVVYVAAVILLTNWFMGSEGLFNRSVMYRRAMTVATYDGYYRDKEPETISSWLHIPSAQVSGPALEFFIAHKAALEDSVLVGYAQLRSAGRDEVLASDSLVLDALAQFYRFKLNGQWLEPVPMVFMNFSRYHQKGLLGFLDISHLDRGLYRLELWLQARQPRRVANLSFYKTDPAEPRPEPPPAAP